MERIHLKHLGRTVEREVWVSIENYVFYNDVNYLFISMTKARNFIADPISKVVDPIRNQILFQFWI